MTNIELPTEGAPALYVTNRFADIAHGQEADFLTADPESVQLTVDLGARRDEEDPLKVGAIILSTRKGYWDNGPDTFHSLAPGQTVQEAKAHSAPVGRAALMAAGREQKAAVLTVFTDRVTEPDLAYGLYSAASRLTDRGQSPLDNMSGRFDRNAGTVAGAALGTLEEGVFHGLMGTPSIAEHLPYVNGSAMSLLAGAVGGAVVGRYLLSSAVHLRRRRVDIDAMAAAENSPPIIIGEDGPAEGPADYPEPPMERERPLRAVPPEDDPLL